MRHSILNYTLILLVSIFMGCEKDPEFDMEETFFSESNLQVSSDIATAISSFKQAEADIFTFDTDTEFIVSAYVISSDEAGNFYKTLIVQDLSESASSGLELKIDLRSYYTKYNFGRKVLIRLSGLSIQEENGKFIVGYFSGNSLVDIPESLLDQHIIRTLETVEIKPRPITLEMVSPELINTFVVLKDVQFSRTELGKSFSYEPYDKYNGERSLVQCDNLAKSYLISSSFANFGGHLLPKERFDLKAVLTTDYAARKIAFVLNNTEGLDLLDKKRCDPLFFECSDVQFEEKKEVIYYENFESLTSSRDIEKLGWVNFNVNFANGRFRKRSKNENVFLQISAYDSKEYVMEVWLVSPEIDLDNSSEEFLSFDSRATFEEGELLTCWFSSDFNGSVFDAKWEQLDVEIAVGSRDGSNEIFRNSGAVSLDCVQGKVRVAFRYLGSDPGASTTYDLDNILVLGDMTTN